MKYFIVKFTSFSGFNFKFFANFIIFNGIFLSFDSVHRFLRRIKHTLFSVMFMSFKVKKLTTTKKKQLHSKIPYSIFTF